MNYQEVSRLLLAPELHEALRLAADAEKAARHAGNRLDEVNKAVTEAEQRLVEIERRCQTVEAETATRRDAARKSLIELTAAIESARRNLE